MRTRRKDAIEKFTKGFDVDGGQEGNGYETNMQTASAGGCAGNRGRAPGREHDTAFKRVRQAGARGRWVGNYI